jgi:AraC-like DNA-binding protein
MGQSASWVRAEWAHEVAAQCQRCVCRLSTLDRVGFQATLDELAGCLPAPRTAPERVFLQHCLHKFTCQAGRRFHQSFHRDVSSRCGGSPLEESQIVWNELGPFDDPRPVLREWARRFVATFNTGHDWPVTWRVAEILRTTPEKRHTLAQLARWAGCSRSCLTRGFREDFGTSIGDFQRRLRTVEAIHLLRTTSLNVGKVASVVGYGSPANLHHAIASLTSMTPIAIRRVDGAVIDTLLERLTPEQSPTRIPPAPRPTGGRRTLSSPARQAES